MSWFEKFLKNLFELDKLEFERIVMKQSVAEEIMHYAKSAYPREFFALLQGEIKDKKLLITNLVYQQYQSSRNSAVYKLDLPLIHDCFGSIHSHPSRSNHPSLADLRSFNKNGVVHFIICYPFGPENLEAYDLDGNPLIYSIQDN
jgi:proteasome lid subunit RPN8/RPN11